jgi:hypothetical protein
MGTYSTYLKNGINLTNPLQNPVSITSTGTIAGGIYGSNIVAWTIVNSGLTEKGNFGVTLVAAGTVTNYGTFSAYHAGVTFGGGGTLVNEGNALIAGGPYGVLISGGAGTITNYGTIQAPADIDIRLGSGGSVRNGTSGLITGDNAGIDINDGAGTVTNYGTISGGRAVDSYGAGAGPVTITNGNSSSAGALISADQGGVLGTDGGTVTNYGTISATGGPGVSLSGTSNVVANFGTIEGGGDGIYIRTGSGGSVRNGANGFTSALIEGGTGIDIIVGAGTVANYGTVKSANISSTGSAGVELFDGGTVVNGNSAATAALVVGYIAVDIPLGAGTVTNYGTIQGLVDGVALGSGGSVQNGAGGSTGAVINGGTGTGVSVRGGSFDTVTNYGTVLGKTGVDLSASTSATLVNAGAILAPGAMAVMLGGGVSSLLVDPGAVFQGTVEGGGSTSTIELASGAATGTLTGLGTSFVSFGTVKVDPGAAWQVSGTSSSAPAFTDDGTILVTNGAALALGAVTADSGEAGLIDLGGASTVEFQSSVADSQTLSFTIGNAAVDLDSPSHFSGAMVNFHVGDTVDLIHVIANAETYSGGVLTLFDGVTQVAQWRVMTPYAGNPFQLTSDGSGGTLLTASPPPNPSPPAGTTADMILSDGSNGDYEIYDLGNNNLLAGYLLGQVGTDYVFAGLGDFYKSDTTDMLLRSTSTGAFEVYDIGNNNITGAAALGQVGLEWQVAGFGDFNGPSGGTDMVLRDTLTGAFEIYDIANNAITAASAIGQVGLEWQVAGFGDFSSKPGETDMVLRDVNTGVFEVYDIQNSRLTSASSLGQVGLEWQVAGFGDFSGNPNETDLMLRDVNTGAFELYDIQNNKITSASAIGQVGLEWQIAGFGPLNGAGTSDMVLRDTQTGAFEVYDIAHNQLTGAASLGQVGLEWGVGGVAPDPLAILAR